MKIVLSSLPLVEDAVVLAEGGVSGELSLAVPATRPDKKCRKYSALATTHASLKFPNFAKHRVIFSAPFLLLEFEHGLRHV